MSKTFEERISEELDALFQGALFLSGGEARDAEELLVDAVTAAYGGLSPDSGQADRNSFVRRLEAQLVRSFLTSAATTEGRHHDVALQGPPVEATAIEHVETDDLFRAASTVPARPRAALWLVHLRRWSYADAAAVMGVERDGLSGLLRYRDVLLRQVLEAHRKRNGSLGLGS